MTSRLESTDHERLLDRLASWAAGLCEGRWLAVLEGGYDLRALAHSVEAHLAVLAGDDA